MSALLRHPTLRAVPPPVSIIAPALLKQRSPAERVAERDELELSFERRIRYRTGRGCWREWRPPGSVLRTCLDLPASVTLHVPPVGKWTRDTVGQVIAIVRAQLVARRATGRCRITARLESYSRVNVITLTVRVGDLRTTVRIDAGRIMFVVPVDVVAAVAELDPHRDNRRALTLARAEGRRGVMAVRP